MNSPKLQPRARFRSDEAEGMRRDCRSCRGDVRPAVRRGQRRPDTAAPSRKADFPHEMFNPDGSEAEVCARPAVLARLRGPAPGGPMAGGV